MDTPLFLFILGITQALCAQDRVREFFEWGEYDSLIAVLGTGDIATDSTGDSLRTCRYLSYLGVANFAKGDIAGARGLFRQALECRDTLTLDRKYVTPEMINLFSSVRAEIASDRARLQQQEALSAAMATEQKERAERDRKAAVLRKSFIIHTVTGASIFAIAAVSGALAANEYASGKNDETLFLAAAREGDKQSYDRLKPPLERKNRNILAYSAASAVSGCLCAWFSYKSIGAYRLRMQLLATGETRAVTLIGDF